MRMCADSKYKGRDTRFYVDVYPALTSMTNPKSGGVNFAWIIEIYELTNN